MTLINTRTASLALAFLMLISLGYCAPHWNTPAPARTQPQPDRAAELARQADEQVAAMLRTYDKMTDAERMRGIVYEP